MGWSQFETTLSWSQFETKLGWSQFETKLTWSQFETKLGWSHFETKQGWSQVATNPIWSLIETEIESRSPISPLVSWEIRDPISFSVSNWVGILPYHYYFPNHSLNTIIGISCPNHIYTNRAPLHNSQYTQIFYIGKLTQQFAHYIPSSQLSFENYVQRKRGTSHTDRNLCRVLRCDGTRGWMAQK